MIRDIIVNIKGIGERTFSIDESQHPMERKLIETTKNKKGPQTAIAKLHIEALHCRSTLYAYRLVIERRLDTINIPIDKKTYSNLLIAQIPIKNVEE